MTDQLSETRTDAEIIWECIYDHGNGKHKGEKSAAQRAEALAALERLKAQLTPQPAALPELLREIVAYCREAGHDWSNLAEAEHMLATLRPQAVPMTGLPDFDELPDDAIDNACAAGGIYRADLMRAWESLRTDGITAPAGGEG